MRKATTKVTGLPNQMFYKCSSLKNVTLPETCTSVGSYAFANCPKLESVYIPASVTEISAKAFKNSSAVTIKGIVVLMQKNTQRLIISHSAPYRPTKSVMLIWMAGLIF